MKNKQKNKRLYILITLFIFSFSMVNTNITVNGEEVSSKNIDLVILFDKDTIDENVKNIIINSGGKIVEEFPEIGGIEVECTSELISTIQAENSVQSLSPNHVIKLLDEEKEELTESEHESNIISADLYKEYQWDIKRVTNNRDSFSLESGNHDVVVGIIDTGVDTPHVETTIQHEGCFFIFRIKKLLLISQ